MLESNTPRVNIYRKSQYVPLATFLYKTSFHFSQMTKLKKKVKKGFTYSFTAVQRLQLQR